MEGWHWLLVVGLAKVVVEALRPVQTVCMVDSFSCLGCLPDQADILSVAESVFTMTGQAGITPDWHFLPTM